MTWVTNHHVSLTHPQTPINRSLPKAFRRQQDILGEENKPSRAQATYIKEDSEVLKLCWNQALKPPATSRTSTSNAKNIRRGIIQIIFLDLKGHWNQAQMPPETSTNYKSVKLYEFKPPKSRRTSTINLQRRRTHQEHAKNTKNVKNKGFPTSS